MLPPALALRKEDAELDARLDAIPAEPEVRREVEDFNARVLKARYTAVDGPPLITMPRDVDETLEAWRDRRTAKLAARQVPRAPEPEPKRRGFFRRRSG
ncbi:hypothetical protein LP418_12910 [Nocardioides sp. B-3]|nr:hypothetical protein [Nocardioides sp. B-3]UUZ61388.1 hypothetical protein LP418_12910 [Nocardioides sp. B-3]